MVGAPALGTEVSLDITTILTGGRVVRGIVEGDAVPQLFLPTLIDLWQRGRFPVDRMMREYDFDQIDEAAHDAEEGCVIKPVLADALMRRDREERTDMASTQTFDAKLMIGGEWVDAADGATFDVLEPFTGGGGPRARRRARRAPRAIEAAAAAFPAWAATPPAERQRVFLAAADILERRTTRSRAG